MTYSTFIKFVAVALGVANLFAGIHPSLVRADDESAAEGKSIFETKCSACHTIGGGRLVGPDLQGVTTLRDPHWLERFIHAPGKVIDSGDTVAGQLLKEYGGLVMPSLGLSDFQVDAVLVYLGQSAHKKETAPLAITHKVTVGDQQQGSRLFTGELSFQRGGVACIACHTVSGISLFGGGALGPDLTGIYRQMGDAGLSSLLANITLPTMQPIYKNRPLTEAEQADLVALFKAEAGQKPVNYAWLIIVAAMAGLVFLFVLIAVIWRKRLKGFGIESVGFMGFHDRIQEQQEVTVDELDQ